MSTAGSGRAGSMGGEACTCHSGHVIASVAARHATTSHRNASMPSVAGAHGSARSQPSARAPTAPTDVTLERAERCTGWPNLRRVLDRPIIAGHARGAGIGQIRACVP